MSDARPNEIEYLGRSPFFQFLPETGRVRAAALYLLPDGLEIEESGLAEIERHRILFSDIRMVTIAPRLEWFGAGVTAVCGLATALAALVLLLVGGGVAQGFGIVFLFVTVAMFAWFVRLSTVPSDVISIYGRRLRVDWAKAPTPIKMKDWFEWLIKKVHEANSAELARVAALRAATRPPPVEVPLPEVPLNEVVEAAPVEAMPLPSEPAPPPGGTTSVS